MHRCLPLLAFALLAVAACDNGRTTAPPPPVVFVEVNPAVTELRIDDAVKLNARSLAEGGAAIQRATPFTWRSTDSTVVRVSSDGIIIAVWEGEASIIATTGGVSGSAKVHVLPDGPASIEIRVPASAAMAGDTLVINQDFAISLSPVIRNRRGEEIVAPLSWRSSEPAIASVDSTGFVSAVTPGATTIIVRSGEITASQEVRVDPPLVVRLAILPDSLVLSPGDSSKVAVKAFGAQDRPRALPALTWSSSATAVATVDSTGLVRALATGDAVITVRSDALAASMRVLVQAPSAPAPADGTIEISQVVPAAVKPGTIIEVRGRGFDGAASEYQATLGGTPLSVLSAAAGVLTARLPQTGFPCTATVPLSLSVTRGSESDAADIPFSSGLSLSLAAGQSRVLDAASAACVELVQASGEYRIAVFNGSATPTATLPFELRGFGAGGTSASAMVSPRLAASPPSPEFRAKRSAASRHLQLIERNRTIAAGEVRLRTSRNQISSRPSMAPAVGDILPAKFPDIDGDLCADFSGLQARVVYSGTFAIVLEDTASPTAGQVDVQLSKLGQEYDTGMHLLVKNNFADPLAYDQFLDANGRLIMLFTPRVNELEGIKGFVSSVDFVPQCAASNAAELFYSDVPADAGTAENWRLRTRSTLVHEVKHLASYAHRFKNAATGGAFGYEEAWLEEATAMLAEEVWIYSLYGLAPQQNLGFQPVLACEAGSGSATCADRPVVMTDHFYFLSNHLSGVEDRTPVGSPRADVNVYGSGWALVRWASDHFAPDPAAFSRALVQTAQSGATNLASRAGVPFDTLAAHFTLAMAVDDLGAGFTPPQDSWLSFRSWNLRDAYAGLRQTYPGAFPAGYPLVPRNAAFGNFTLSSAGIPGGTASIVALGGAPVPGQRLALVGGGGGAVSPSLGLHVVRVR